MHGLKPRALLVSLRESGAVRVTTEAIFPLSRASFVALTAPGNHEVRGDCFRWNASRSVLAMTAEFG